MILLYGFTAEEVGRITGALGGVGVPAPGVLRPSQGHVRLSEIILHDTDGTEEVRCSERLVLFHNLSEAGIGTLVRFIRGLGVGRPIFAVVTETSFRWTLAELLEHLVEEKRALEARGSRASPGTSPSTSGGESAPAPPGPARNTADPDRPSPPGNQPASGDSGSSPDI
jgi:hypothetical protein